MGFGILIFGYALLLSVPYKGVDIPPDVVGYALMCFALFKLGSYDKRLKVAAVATLPLVALSLFTLYTQLTQTWEGLKPLLTLADMALQFILYVPLFLGISSLAKSVDLPGVAWRAKRNLVVMVLFYAFTVYTNLYAIGAVPMISGVTASALTALYLLSFYAVWALNTVLFVSCYMRICLEGDEDMPYEPGPLERKLNEIKENAKSKK